MAVSDDFLAFVRDQLRDIEGLRVKRMFGGCGLYAGEAFFGILHDDTLYLKTDDRTRPRYEAAGMRPFQPTPRQTLRRYFETPADVLESRERLTAWAREAVEAG